LTQAKPVVEIHYHVRAEEEQQVKLILALLEQHSSHFMADAIYTTLGGNELIIQSGLRVDSKQVVQHRDGVAFWLEGKQYLLGNCDYLSERHGIKIADDCPGQNYLMVLANRTVQKLATIVIVDPLRSSAEAVVPELVARKLDVALSTGMSIKTAHHFGKKIGFYEDNIYSTSLDDPKKRTKVSVVQEKGPLVCMVGDGVNDVVAMEAAHVSMVMCHRLGDHSAQQNARVRILDGRVMSIVRARDIAHQAMQNLRENLWGSLLYNCAVVLLTVVLLLAFGVVLHPGIGAALMVLQVCLIFWHANRFKQQALPSYTAALKERGLFGHEAQNQFDDEDINAELSLVSCWR